MLAADEQPVISRAKRSDFGALGQVWLEMMRQHESEDPHFALAPDALLRWLQMAQEMLERDDAFIIKAEVGGTIAGFVLGWVALNPPIYKDTRLGFVSEVAVARWAQRRGIGSAMIAAARQWFKAHGLDEFQLSTAVWNDAARRFWERVGGEPLLVRYRFAT